MWKPGSSNGFDLSSRDKTRCRSRVCWKARRRVEINRGEDGYDLREGVCVVDVVIVCLWMWLRGRREAFPCMQTNATCNLRQ